MIDKVTFWLTHKVTDWLSIWLKKAFITHGLIFCLFCFTPASFPCSDPSSFTLSHTITPLLLGDIRETFHTGLLWSSRSTAGTRVSPACVSLCDYYTGSHDCRCTQTKAGWADWKSERSSLCIFYCISLPPTACSLLATVLFPSLLPSSP